ncbi:MAG: DEAD/DEAH box helicase family protein [Desulfatitalea sp.]|nr:DEAD/DEAH box helicase family protein [Desulfatitalea sp.]
MQTLKDILAHLSFLRATRMLGDKGKALIMKGGKYDIDPVEHVRLDEQRFELSLPDATVRITLDPHRPKQLNLSCSNCTVACEHQGAALALILEEKLALGLAAPPPERVPIESLDENTLAAQALADRRERAHKEKMVLQSMDRNQLWTDYIVTSKVSGKSYRIALRGFAPGESYCSCPDFRKNTLGTCKHILYVQGRLKTKFPKKVRQTPPTVETIAVYLRYLEQMELRLLLPEHLAPEIEPHLAPLRDRSITDVRDLLRRIGQVERLGTTVTLYPDAEAYIQHRLFQQRMTGVAEEIRQDPSNHPLRHTLLKAALLPYQLDGIAFAAGAGRAILADDMGLGKTIQAIGTAELLARHAAISKVLVICPASLKSQWRTEIRRFSDRTCRVVLGSAADRPAQYADDAFFTICNYEQVLRDILAVETVAWDLIILDEGQRIKNWEAKTSQVLKALQSPFALVLTGTLEENLLGTLSAKNELALAVLDPEADTTEVDLTTGIDELKRRMEVLLGNKPDAPEDESQKAEATREAAIFARREKIADAGGQLVTAAFAFIGEVLGDAGADERMAQMTGAFKAKLSECMETTADGQLKMTVTLPGPSFLDTMARSLAQMVSAGNPQG